MTETTSVPPLSRPRLWTPKRVLVTRAAADYPHADVIVERARRAGVTDIQFLPNDRLVGLRGETERQTYALAKSTLAVVVAPPSARRPQPIPPSADWRIDLARGCPAHCQYCYLAGSLTGPPVTRVYANLDEVLGGIPSHVGRGQITSPTAARGAEGTTFELSCYTDPLGIEHLTGALAESITRAGSGDFGTDLQLRFTTKFDAVEPLLALPHAGRTRVRFSVNADAVAARFEGGTAAMPARLAALRAMAEAGYPVGLTIAPIMPVPRWREEYGRLLGDVAAALAPVPEVDLSVELITHRFTPGSRDVLLDWYPQTKLELDPEQRTQKRSKFGGVKYVYPRPQMTELRSWFTGELARTLPAAQLLYWT